MSEKQGMRSCSRYPRIFALLAIGSGLLLQLALGARVRAAEPLPEISPTLETWDRLLEQAPDFRSFAANPELKARFLSQLQAYFGADKIKTENFERILGQLQELDRKVPGFGEALWKKRPPRPVYALQYDLGKEKDYSLDAAAWGRELERIENRLRIHAGRLLAISDPEVRRQELAKRVAEIENANRSFQQKLNSGPEQARIRARYPDPKQADAYIKSLRDRYERALHASPAVREVVSYATYQRLHGEERFRDALRSGHGTTVVGALTELQNDFQKIFESPDFAAIKSIPKPLRTLARDIMPNAQVLANNRSLFTVAEKGSERMVFYDVHRPLYAVFRGVFTGECVGGACGYLDSTNPERHAVPALQGAEVRFAEVAGEKPHRGFMELVPVRKAGSEARYDSLIIGVPDLKRKVYTRTSADEPAVESSIYDLWIKEATKRGARVVSGAGASSDNAAVLGTVRSSASYQFGEPVARRGQFQHLPENEELVRGIVGKVETKGGNYGARKQLVFEATLPEDGEVTELLPLSEKEIEARLRSATPEGKRSFFERTMDMDSGQKQRFYKRVRFLLKDGDARIRRSAALWIVSGKIRDPEVPAVLLEASKASDLTRPEAAAILKFHQAPDLAGQEIALNLSEHLENFDTHGDSRTTLLALAKKHGRDPQASLERAIRNDFSAPNWLGSDRDWWLNYCKTADCSWIRAQADELVAPGRKIDWMRYLALSELRGGGEIARLDGLESYIRELPMRKEAHDSLFGFLRRHSGITPAIGDALLELQEKSQVYEPQKQIASLFLQKGWLEGEKAATTPAGKLCTLLSNLPQPDLETKRGADTLSGLLLDSRSEVRVGALDMLRKRRSMATPELSEALVNALERYPYDAPLQERGVSMMRSMRLFDDRAFSFARRSAREGMRSRAAQFLQAYLLEACQGRRISNEELRQVESDVARLEGDLSPTSRGLLSDFRGKRFEKWARELETGQWQGLAALRGHDASELVGLIDQLQSLDRAGRSHPALEALLEREEPELVTALLQLFGYQYPKQEVSPKVRQWAMRRAASAADSSDQWCAYLILADHSSMDAELANFALEELKAGRQSIGLSRLLERVSRQGAALPQESAQAAAELARIPGPHRVTEGKSGPERIPSAATQTSKPAFKACMGLFAQLGRSLRSVIGK